MLEIEPTYQRPPEVAEIATKLLLVPPQKHSVVSSCTIDLPLLDCLAILHCKS